MDKQMKIIFLIIGFIILTIIVISIIIMILKKEKAISHITVNKKLYDLPFNSPNVQLFGLETKDNTEQQFRDEDLDKTQLINVNDMVEIINIQEIKEIENMEK